MKCPLCEKQMAFNWTREDCAVPSRASKLYCWQCDCGYWMPCDRDGRVPEEDEGKP